MGTIRFELRKEKTDKGGEAPIRIIYQVKGVRKYYSTGEKVNEINWDEKLQRAVYIKKGVLLNSEVKKLNDGLGDLERKIEKIEQRFKLDEVAYSAEMVIDELNRMEVPETKRDTSSKELYAFIDKFLIDNEYSKVKGSLSVYKSLKTHLQGFEQKNKVKIAFDSINYPFFKSFQNYMFGLTKKDKDGKTVKALNNITIAKQLSTLKTLLNNAKANGIDVSTKYESFKIQRDGDLEVIALTQGELNLLLNLDLSKKPAWDQVRDVFCFSCATGLRFSDLKQLRREHIKDDRIELKAVKTGHKTMIPLNSTSTAILKKYINEPVPLPVISNQRSNEHLSKICDFAGINSPVEISRKYGNQMVKTVYKKFELIRMHCGRKTFATVSMERGMSAEHVMKIGGWKDYKSFKRYINITDESAKNAMNQAWGVIIDKQKLKAV